MPDTLLYKMTAEHCNLIHREFDNNKKYQHDLHYVFMLPQNGPHIRHTIYYLSMLLPAWSYITLHGHMRFKNVNSSALGG